MKNCEYFLVRYASSALRETRIAIGLFLFDDSGRLVRHRLTDDWRPVRCLDPGADLALLRSLPAHFEQLVGEIQRQGLPETNSGAGFYQHLWRLHEDSSGCLQIGQPQGVLTENPEEEFQRLYREHVERVRPQRVKSPLREGSRPWVHARLSEALQRHDLWDRLEHNIPVEDFTAPGDAFRIDFSYRPNGILRYLHALSLERDWNQAKLLSYTFWRIRQKAAASMTAVVADELTGLPAVQSCRQILSDSGVAIQPLGGINHFLEKIREEWRIN
ncbi:MAG: DUF3037 domain-containing protein [Acidobacteria bacterium]|nr:DUF3037 domain-containing protein [Acidobacteriota bacterium]